MGTPKSQVATVVFDTGSEYLTLTSVLCDDKTAGNIKFKKYNPVTGNFQKNKNGDQKRCQTMAYNMHKSASQKMLAHTSSKLTYGSAKTQGFIW